MGKLDSLTAEKFERFTDAVAGDLKDMNALAEEIRVREKMEAILPMISVSYLAKHYFGKSSSWLYHKMDGRDGNGKPTCFTAEEIEELKGALLDLSNRIRRAAESI